MLLYNPKEPYVVFGQVRLSYSQDLADVLAKNEIKSRITHNKCGDQFLLVEKWHGVTLTEELRTAIQFNNLVLRPSGPNQFTCSNSQIVKFGGIHLMMVDYISIGVARISVYQHTGCKRFKNHSFRDHNNVDVMLLGDENNNLFISTI